MNKRVKYSFITFDSLIVFHTYLKIYKITHENFFLSLSYMLKKNEQKYGKFYNFSISASTASLSVKDGRRRGYRSELPGG